jgi:hypothetical protein
MKTGVFALFLVPFLTMPVFAGSLNVGDKPMVVAEGADVRIGGVRVGVGERHRHRDHPGAGLYVSDRGHPITIATTTTARIKCRRISASIELDIDPATR